MTPIIEPWDDRHSLVTFEWRGEAETTRAWWNLDVPLERVPGTDLWKGSAVLPSDLHTIYCITHDGAESIPDTPTTDGPVHLDASNPRRVHFQPDPLDPADEPAWASELILPDAPPEPWTAVRPGVTAGRLTRTAIDSEHPITLYLPYGVAAAGLPVLVVFDAVNALTLQAVPTILDNLIAAGAIPPVAALFVHNFVERRDAELSPVVETERFITGALLPWARERWGVGSPTGRNLVAGCSRGGLVATYLGLRRPDLFAAAIAQSGSFWWPSPAEGTPGQLIRDVAALPRSGTRFWVDVGTLETQPGPGGAPSQLDACRDLRDALRAGGFQVTYAEFTGGHDYVNWRRTFADALIAVYPA